MLRVLRHDAESGAKPHAPATDANPAQSLYQHDGAGNMTVKGGTTFGYDALNRLVSASGSLPIAYGYDDSTERVTKQVGSDRSVFLGPDIEIMNRVRLVKTIRANGEIIARVETMLPGGSGAGADGVVRGLGNSLRRVPDELLALTLLLVLAGIAGALQQHGSGSVPGRAVASSLAVLLVVLPLIPRLARAAIKGDVTNDNRVDAADLLLLLRHVNDGVVLPVDPGVGDVAPWSSGTLGDGARNSADVMVLTRGISEPDLDGDGLSPRLEALVGTSPLVADSDGDGTPDALEDVDQDGSSNSDELLAGSDPTLADTDGDGIVDSRDARPTQFDGERAVWVHTDHLGSVSVLSDAAGAVVRRISYEVWGAVRSNVATPGTASLDSAEKFTGQRYDAETSLYYYGARYYDPGLGRFVGADAMIASQYRTSALQPYAYVESNPLNFVDPSGNFSTQVPSGGGGYGWNRPDRNTSRSLLTGLASLWQDAFDRAMSAFQAGNPTPAQAGPQAPSQPARPFQPGSPSEGLRLPTTFEDGSPLPDPVIDTLRPYFEGFDLTQIRIHNGIPGYVAGDADAYTSKNDIYFAEGVYDPNTASGIALIGHEVRHSQQYEELGTFRFRARYASEYLGGRLRGLGHDEAYRNISLERQGYGLQRRIESDLIQAGRPR